MSIKIIYRIPVGIVDWIEVITLVDMGAYEWRLYGPTKLLSGSNENYGTPEAALRDALIVYLS